MIQFESASEADRSLVVRLANGGAPDPLDEMLGTPLGVACAAYSAVEESWNDLDAQRVLTAIAPNLSTGDPSVVAALAIRGAMLDTWWVRDRKNPDAWDQALSWAKIATESRPDWLLGWLLLVDGHLYRGEIPLALNAASHTLLLAQPRRPSNQFLVAADILFGGGATWTTRQAEDLVTRVRDTPR